MLISAIAACDSRALIGQANSLPWHIPVDLQYFKALSTGHCILMGRNCFRSIGRALPGRTNILLSRSTKSSPEGIELQGSLEGAIDFARSTGEQELFIIGGAELYKSSMQFWDCLYLNQIQAEFSGDSYFPLGILQYWELRQNIVYPPTAKNEYELHFQKWLAPQKKAQRDCGQDIRRLIARIAAKQTRTDE